MRLKYYSFWISKSLVLIGVLAGHAQTIIEHDIPMQNNTGLPHITLQFEHRFSVASVGSVSNRMLEVQIQARSLGVKPVYHYHGKIYGPADFEPGSFGKVTASGVLLDVHVSGPGVDKTKQILAKPNAFSSSASPIGVSLPKHAKESDYRLTIQRIKRVDLVHDNFTFQLQRKEADEQNKKIAERIKNEQETQKEISKLVQNQIAAEQTKTTETNRRKEAAIADIELLQRQQSHYQQNRLQKEQAMERIRADYTAKAAASRARHEAALEAVRSRYSTQLVKEDDDFWNETFTAYKDYKAYRMYGSNVGFKDPETDEIVFPQEQSPYKEAFDFSGGLSVGKLAETNEWVIINQRMAIVKKLDKAFIRDLRKRVAPYLPLVTLNDIYISEVKDGYIYYTGRFEAIGANGSGSSTQPNQYGVLDRRGNVIALPRFSKIEPFEKGLAKAEVYLDEERIAEENEQENLRAFLSIAYLEAGLIDRNGNWAESPSKVFRYSSSIGDIRGVLFVEDKNITSEERRRNELAYRNRRKGIIDGMRERLEATTSKKIEEALALGYIVEKRN